jgi:hypothetical protein
MAKRQSANVLTMTPDPNSAFARWLRDHNLSAPENLTSEKQFCAWLRSLCDATSPGEVAAAAGISSSFLSQLLAGRSPVGPQTARRFGYVRKRVVTFTPIDKESPQ